MPQKNSRQAVGHQVGSKQPTELTKRPQKLLLTEMFARLHGRSPGVLPETTKATIWRLGAKVGYPSSHLKYANIVHTAGFALMSGSISQPPATRKLRNM